MKPGVYDDLSNVSYHAETDWLGSSQLKRHLPEHYKTGDPTSAMDFGTAFHSAVLGVGEPLHVVDALTWTGKAAKEEQTKARNLGLTPILAKDVPVLEGMVKAVQNHPEASRLLFGEPGRNELSVFAEEQYGETVLQTKARYDRLLDYGTAVDLKTTSKGPGVYNLTRAVIDYGYDLSAEHYVRVGQAGGLPVESLLLVFVSKESPHYVTVVDLGDDFYNRGKLLRDMAVDRLMNPSMMDAYEGASKTVQLGLPRWAVL